MSDLANTLEKFSVDTLRLLAADTVQKANSGHPGAPMALAPIAYVLFNQVMGHNPAHSKWANRDRFVLSNGHASSLLYGSLFLSGYKVTLEDLKSFRQWGSKTPGHPEFGHTDGVEATTGPLGQGFAMAVGMAIAERHLAAVYNQPGFAVVDGVCDLLEQDAAEAVDEGRVEREPVAGGNGRDGLRQRHAGVPRGGGGRWPGLPRGHGELFYQEHSLQPRTGGAAWLTNFVSEYPRAACRMPRLRCSSARGGTYTRMGGATSPRSTTRRLSAC